MCSSYYGHNIYNGGVRYMMQFIAGVSVGIVIEAIIAIVVIMINMDK